jgi:hypothetical protein
MQDKVSAASNMNDVLMIAQAEIATNDLLTGHVIVSCFKHGHCTFPSA